MSQSFFDPSNVAVSVPPGYPMTPQGRQNIIKRIVVCCDGYVLMYTLTHIATVIMLYTGLGKMD
ncbi:hypothetical protein BDW22DRAFT_1350809 [Trametopsis cervina]|nr:hypothetical protein BDW22DRAFT_1350809 [Trametopsis cervina]